MMRGAPRGVLALTLNSSMGGTEKSLLSLYGRMNKLAFVPCLVTLVGDGSLVRLARERGLDAFHLGMRGPADATAVLRLTEIIRQREISIVHTYLYHTGILGRLLGWANAVPAVVCSQRSTDDWRSAAHIWADRLSQGLVDAYVANCETIAERLRRVERIRPEKIRVIPTGIEPMPPANPEACAALRKEFSIAPDATVLGTVANLRPAKGHAVLIAAAKNIVSEFPKAVFVWVGDGPLRAALQKSIEQAGLSRHFRFAGFQSDPSSYYGIFDLFVLPSLWEGRPLALLEAMSQGLPIVATRAGGVEEMLADGAEGKLVEVNDAEALARAVTDMLRAPAAAADMGRKARERFEIGQSLDAYVSRTGELYEKLLQEKSHR